MEEIKAKFSLEQNEPLKASFTAYNEPPSIVIEGTENYNELENKPSINDVVLEGNKTLDELGIQEKGNYATKTDLQTLANEVNTSIGDINTILDNINGEVI